MRVNCNNCVWQLGGIYNKTGKEGICVEKKKHLKDTTAQNVKAIPEGLDPLKNEAHEIQRKFELNCSSS